MCFDKGSDLFEIGQSAARGFFVDSFCQTCQHFARSAFGGFGNAFCNERVDGFRPAYRTVKLADKRVFDFLCIVVSATSALWMTRICGCLISTV